MQGKSFFETAQSLKTSKSYLMAINKLPGYHSMNCQDRQNKCAYYSFPSIIIKALNQLLHPSVSFHEANLKVKAHKYLGKVLKPRNIPERLHIDYRKMTTFLQVSLRFLLQGFLCSQVFPKGKMLCTRVSTFIQQVASQI